MCHPPKTCSNVTISEKNKEIIDLTEMPEPSTQKPWKVIGTTHLYSEEEKILKKDHSCFTTAFEATVPRHIGMARSDIAKDCNV